MRPDNPAFYFREKIRSQIGMVGTQQVTNEYLLIILKEEPEGL